MQGSYINNYIKSMVERGISLNDVRKIISNYKSLRSRVNEKIFYRAIDEVKKTKNAKGMNDLEVYTAYERDVKIVALTKQYNITTDIAEIIIDLDIPYTSVILAEVIWKFKLRNNPKVMELARIIVDKKLEDNPNALVIAERILKHKLEDYIGAVEIVNMVYEYGVPLDLAIEVSKFNHCHYYNYKFKQNDERYIFHKLRQIYQVKMRVEKDFKFSREVRRISEILDIITDSAQYLLYCCMGNNWGRNSRCYWDFDRFKSDVASNRVYTKDEINVISDYTIDSVINTYARGFKTNNGRTSYANYAGGVYVRTLENKEIMDKNEKDFLPLYLAVNKYSLPKDVIVFRGVEVDALNKYDINYEDSEEEIKRKLAGYYQDGGFLSTSAVITDETEYLSRDVNFIINLKAGTPCEELSNYSHFEDECEVLIPPNVTFIVNDVKKLNNRILIYLTSIPTKSISYVSSIEEEKEDTDSENKKM